MGACAAVWAWRASHSDSMRPTLADLSGAPRRFDCGGSAQPDAGQARAHASICPRPSTRPYTNSGAMRPSAAATSARGRLSTAPTPSWSSPSPVPFALSWFSVAPEPVACVATVPTRRSSVAKPVVNRLFDNRRRPLHKGRVSGVGLWSVGGVRAFRRRSGVARRRFDGETASPPSRRGVDPRRRRRHS